MAEFTNSPQLDDYAQEMGVNPAALAIMATRGMVEAARGFSGQRLRVRGVVFDFEGNRIFDTEEATRP